MDQTGLTKYRSDQIKNSSLGDFFVQGKGGNVIDRKADSILIPFLCQQKIADIAVLDPVSAHVELIQRDNIFLKL